MNTINDALACVAYNKSGLKNELIEVVGDDMYKFLVENDYIIEMPPLNEYVLEKTRYPKEWVVSEKCLEYIADKNIVPVRIVRSNEHLVLPQTMQEDKSKQEFSWIMLGFIALIILLFQLILDLF